MRRASRWAAGIKKKRNGASIDEGIGAAGFGGGRKEGARVRTNTTQIREGIEGAGSCWGGWRFYSDTPTLVADT